MSCVTRSLKSSGFVLVLLMIPAPAFAGVVITEIMYNLEGADSNREWIEVTNVGSAPVGLNGYRFFESDTNHRLEVVQGSAQLAAGASAVIADDAEQFRSDWPDYSGMLFDSSFALKNTGETLTIRDPGLNDLDSVTYSPDWGADGTGESLQLSGSDWIAAAPTPGTTGDVPQESAGTQQSAENTDSEQSGPLRPRIEPEFYADAGGDRTVIAGADTTYTGVGLTPDGEELTKVEFIWNFGNGEMKRGREVIHHYDYPGTYRVFLTVASGKTTASDAIRVRAVAPNVGVSDESADFVELTNHSDRELDLSGWFLAHGNREFRLPENTYILPDTSVRIASEASGIAGSAILLFPNGEPVPPPENEPTTDAPEETNTPVRAQQRTAAHNTAPESAPPRQNVPSEEETDSSHIAAVATAQAAPSQGPAGGEEPLWPWLAAVLGVVGVGVVGYAASRVTSEGSPAYDATATDTVDEYTVVEETGR